MNEGFDEIFQSLGNLTKGSLTTLSPKDSTGVDLDDWIADHIYGLLSKDTLSVEEITLLSALLQTWNKRSR